jgi:hypothetical protein
MIELAYRAYTGIGSRNIPAELESIIVAIARALAARGYILRSGGATGADTFFERGAGAAAEIYVPTGFNGQTQAGARRIVPAGEILDRCFLLASVVHPNWGACSDYVRLLHSRNVCQVFGERLNVPSDFLICWKKLDSRAEVSGGTRLAWDIAGKAGVPRYNLAVPADLEAVQKILASAP